MYVPRRRDLDCLESDAELASYVQTVRYEVTKALYYSWSAYIAAYVGTDFDNKIDFCSEIKRTNEPMRNEYIVEAKHFEEIIENVLQVSLFMILSDSLKSESGFYYSIDNRYPQIPFGYGIHVATPVCFSDKACKQIPKHLAYDVFVNYVSNMLNAYEGHYVAGNVSKPTHQYLEEILSKIVFTTQLPKYNIFILSAVCLR